MQRLVAIGDNLRCNHPDPHLFLSHKTKLICFITCIFPPRTEGFAEATVLKTHLTNHSFGLEKSVSFGGCLLSVLFPINRPFPTCRHWFRLMSDLHE
jgi:hypothetical protein